MDLADNSINQYNISELISSKSVDYMMDMKLENSIGETLLTSDSLKVGKYSLGGAVKIQNIQNCREHFTVFCNFLLFCYFH